MKTRLKGIIRKCEDTISEKKIDHRISLNAMLTRYAHDNSSCSKIGPSPFRNYHITISPKLKKLNFPQFLKKYKINHSARNASQSAIVDKIEIKQRTRPKTEFGHFDDSKLIYKQIVAKVDLYSVTSSLSMEVLKHNTELPLP